ncbi:hypothetical protein [Bacillus sp. AFS017336]|uniref:hypothetical protein n=1 Tax=Bacillus sp. AFS017336 TaxID=2033489 RepID=UPI000BEFF59D|nr:hypothetical protein [Bacillus sp. AFS017336]PEL12665.1 hypothetical protein CN601_06875 [Bacillus sp. AFS017336]
MSDERLGAVIEIIDDASRPMDNIIRVEKALEKQTQELAKMFGKLNETLNVTRTVSNAERDLTRLQRQVSTTEKVLGGLRKGVNIAIKVTDLATKPITSIGKKLFSLNGMLVAAATGYAAQNAVKSTVGQALEFDLTKKQLEYVAKNRGLNGKNIMNLAQQTSLTSMFSQKEIYDTFAGMLSYAKKDNQTKQLTDMAQLLAYTDPMQGMSGAKVAIQELLGGDAKSLYMRFEKIPKAVADKLATYADKNPITKGNNLDGFIKLFNDSMKSTGYDKNFVHAMESTSYGKYLSSMENIQTVLRKIGEAALPNVTRMIDKFNAKMNNGGIEKISKLFGKLSLSISKVADRALDGLIKNAPKIGKKLDSIFTSFSKTVDDLLSGKKSFGDAVNEWLGKGLEALNSFVSTNQAAITATMDTFTEYIIGVLQAHTGDFVSAGAGIGKAILDGILQGIGNKLTNIPGLKQLGQLSEWTGKSDNVVAKVLGGGLQAYDKQKLKDQHIKDSQRMHRQARAIGGIVQRDNTPTLLHRGEEVKTQREVTRDKFSPKSSGVVVNMYGTVVREEADIDKIGNKFLKNLVKHNVSFGGAND